MSQHSEEFLVASEIKSFDLEHRRTINYNMGKYETAVSTGLSRFQHLENSKRRAHTIKWKTMENLDKYLLEFEQNFTRKGGKVIWANNAEEANKEILALLKRRNVKTVVKSKSMATEEIELNEVLENEGIEALETDLGEYIIQLLGKKQYHIIKQHIDRNRVVKGKRVS